MDNPEFKTSEEALSAEHQQLLEWWKDLDQHRGDRAALRRASSIEQAMFNPAFHRLWRRLKRTRWNRADRVALIAALAARVREPNSGKSFAAQLGTASKGRTKAPLSGLRFRRLLQATEPDELLQACTRAIAMCRNTVNLLNLADRLYWWSDEDRKKLAFDYYDANPSAD